MRHRRKGPGNKLEQKKGPWAWGERDTCTLRAKESGELGAGSTPWSAATFPAVTKSRKNITEAGAQPLPSHLQAGTVTPCAWSDLSPMVA